MTFDSIAPHYDLLERWFSRGLMHRARTAFLSEIEHCNHALLLGEGPGRFLPLVLQRFPGARITCVDSSPRMLILAQNNIGEGDRNRVSLLQADIRSWQAAGQDFDLLVTNFFLDCFNADELDRVIPAVTSAATRDAHWLISDFNIPPRGFAKWRAAIIVGSLYRFFRFAAGLTARQWISPQPWLERAGFRLHRRREIDLGLLRSDWWMRDHDSE
jgi:ubiquinone/menaquinone biosynthesis C-methylase UbiE